MPPMVPKIDANFDSERMRQYTNNGPRIHKVTSTLNLKVNDLEIVRGTLERNSKKAWNGYYLLSKIVLDATVMGKMNKKVEFEFTRSTSTHEHHVIFKATGINKYTNGYVDLKWTVVPTGYSGNMELNVKDFKLIDLSKVRNFNDLGGFMYRVSLVSPMDLPPLSIKAKYEHNPAKPSLDYDIQVQVDGKLKFSNTVSMGKHRIVLDATVLGKMKKIVEFEFTRSTSTHEHHAIFKATGTNKYTNGYVDLKWTVVPSGHSGNMELHVKDFKFIDLMKIKDKVRTFKDFGRLVSGDSNLVSPMDLPPLSIKAKYEHNPAKPSLDYDMEVQVDGKLKFSNKVSMGKHRDAHTDAYFNGKLFSSYALVLKFPLKYLGLYNEVSDLNAEFESSLNSTDLACKFMSKAKLDQQEKTVYKSDTLIKWSPQTFKADFNMETGMFGQEGPFYKAEIDMGIRPGSHMDAYFNGKIFDRYALDFVPLIYLGFLPRITDLNTEFESSLKNTDYYKGEYDVACKIMSTAKLNQQVKTLYKEDTLIKWSPQILEADVKMETNMFGDLAIKFSGKRTGDVALYLYPFLPQMWLKAKRPHFYYNRPSDMKSKILLILTENHMFLKPTLRSRIPLILNILGNWMEPKVPGGSHSRR
jgi:hypothetical protein